ncbi:AAA family ATPase [Sphingobacterium corticibacterium]|uniref:ATPase n=1 Tax=Sphingobacterium corticibacterium TaxID=2484746 RepID=A0A4Q6XNJ5_9SPHI|nr:AAA family ATPase [Sphingobacterium corticibacterium]RZF61733.1 ATPase [Sphingobacterium corticibacterium]
MENQIAHNSCTPAPERIISSHYDYSKVFQFIDRKGKELYGNRFAVSADDQSILLQLAAYFLRDEEVCDRHRIDLEKGIMLTGPIGCGKTTLMNLMRYLTGNANRYIMKSTRDVTFEFIQDGYEVIHRYSRGKLYNAEYKNFCFDDLGTENNIKYFGNECNVMAEVLLSRYDLFVSKKLVTHITTNLSATELEQTYGNRLRSRLREMVNLIGFDKEVTDKRK